jgi:Flp pilus assembly protein TadG
MRSRSPRDAAECGAVTAELAVVLPAVLLVLAGCLGALRLGVEQARMDAAASVVARSIARGDPPETADARGGAAGAAAVVVDHRAGVVCARAETWSSILGLPLPVTGTSCALEP